MTNKRVGLNNTVFISLNGSVNVDSLAILHSKSERNYDKNHKYDLA